MRRHLIVGVTGLAACVLPLAGCPCAEKVCAMVEDNAVPIATYYGQCCKIRNEGGNYLACIEAFNVWSVNLQVASNQYAIDCKDKWRDEVLRIINTPPEIIKRQLDKARANVIPWFKSDDALAVAIYADPVVTTAEVTAVEVAGKAYLMEAAGEAIAQAGTSASGEPSGAVTATVLGPGSPAVGRAARYEFATDRSSVLGTFRGEVVAFEVAQGSLWLSPPTDQADGGQRMLPTEFALVLSEASYEVRMMLDKSAAGNELVINDGVGMLVVRAHSELVVKAEGDTVPMGPVWLHIPVVADGHSLAMVSDVGSFLASGDAQPVPGGSIVPLHADSPPPYNAAEDPQGRPPWIDVPPSGGDGCADLDGDLWPDGLEREFGPYFQLICRKCGYDCAPTPAAE